MVFGGADLVRAAPGRGRHRGGGCLPPDGYQRGDLLRLKEEIRKPGRERGARAASAPRRELQAEALGGRSDARQAHHGRDHPKKRLRPARKRELVEWVQTAFGTSLSRACRLVWISRSLHAYRSRRPGQEGLRTRMRDLAQGRPRYGYRRLHVLLRRDGWKVNMKRVRRLYRLEGLQLRYRLRRRKHASVHRGIPPAASRAHERWSMDFVHDALMDGRAFRVLTVVDQWSRWSPILEVAQNLSGSQRCGRLGPSDLAARVP